MRRAALEGLDGALKTCSIRGKQVADGDARTVAFGVSAWMETHAAWAQSYGARVTSQFRNLVGDVSMTNFSRTSSESRKSRSAMNWWMSDSRTGAEGPIFQKAMTIAACFDAYSILTFKFNTRASFRKT